jgi:hypothetical protein
MSNINVVKYIEKKDFFCFCTQSSKLQKNISFTCGKTIKNNGAGYPVSFTAIFKIENPKPLWLKASRVYFF